MPRVHIKKNDMVYVLSGRDREKTGKVLKVYPAENKALVEGLNTINKHTKPNPQKNVKGGILERAERLMILFIGILLAALDLMYLTYVIALLAVLANISALQRIWIAVKLTRD